jgi:DNA-binding response OmpR family regulator
MNNKRILIIDDDLPLAQSLKLNLEDTGGYDVHVESKSMNALSTARAFHPDVILLDYIMPGVDGGDVSAQFRADASLRDVPIIMVTALISNNETGETGSVHRNGHTMVAKPVKFDKLLRCIEISLHAAAA